MSKDNDIHDRHIVPEADEDFDAKDDPTKPEKPVIKSKTTKQVYDAHYGITPNKDDENVA